MNYLLTPLSNNRASLRHPLGEAAMTIAGDVISKVVSSIVVDGLQRGYHGLRTAVRRRQAVGRALAGETSNVDAPLAAAIADLNRIIGEAACNLTEYFAATILS